MKLNKRVIVIVLVGLLLISCGKQEQSAAVQGPADMLVAAVDSLGLERSSEVRVFVGDSLWEYINGGAELYHKYLFVDVATADYVQRGTELVVDIYRFHSPGHAYGLYTMVRPESPQTAAMGIDGFSSPSNLVFVKGPHVVMVTAYDQGERVSDALVKTAGFFNGAVTGTVNRPEEFAVFPEASVVIASDVIFAESFMGQVFLKDVYCQKCDLAGDTLLLFISDDEAGAKFVAWKEQIGGDSRAVDNIPFDEGLSVRFTHSYYGEVVTGLSSGRLAGAVGFKDEHSDFISQWVKSLAAAGQ